MLFRSDLMRAHALGNGQHCIRAGHFEVERRADRGLQAGYVVILYVATVLAQVGRNPVGARVLAEACRGNGIRFVGPPGLPDRRDVIDVDAEAQVHMRQ